MREAIFQALHGAHKRVAATELGYLAKQKSVELKVSALEVLIKGVGGRYGALAAQEFIDDDSSEIRELAIHAIEQIGGAGGPAALKQQLKGKCSPSLVMRLFKALVTIGNAEAAEVLLAFCVPKGPYQEIGEDSLVEIGGPAILPSINAFANRSVAKQAHNVLKRITDQTYGQSVEKWMDWYQKWLINPTPLPKYKRGSEPWLGGGYDGE